MSTLIIFANNPLSRSAYPQTMCLLEHFAYKFIYKLRFSNLDAAHKIRQINLVLFLLTCHTSDKPLILIIYLHKK